MPRRYPGALSPDSDVRVDLARSAPYAHGTRPQAHADNAGPTLEELHDEVFLSFVTGHRLELTHAVGAYAPHLRHPRTGPSQPSRLLWEVQCRPRPGGRTRQTTDQLTHGQAPRCHEVPFDLVEVHCHVPVRRVDDVLGESGEQNLSVLSRAARSLPPPPSGRARGDLRGVTHPRHHQATGLREAQLFDGL